MPELSAPDDIVGRLLVEPGLAASGAGADGSSIRLREPAT